MLVVEPDIEKRPAVCGPLQVAIGTRDALIDEGAGFRIDHADGVKLGAVGVDGIGDQPVIRAVSDAGDPEICVLGRKRVAVDEDALLAALAGDPAKEGMLPAGDEAGVIRVGAIRGGTLESSSLMRPFISAKRCSCRACVSAKATAVWAFSASRCARMSGPRTAGSCITSCQFSARSQA